MPKRRGNRTSLRAAADRANANPPAAPPPPRWVTRLVEWIVGVHLIEELEAIQRQLELVLEVVRSRIAEHDRDSGGRGVRRPRRG